MTVVRLGASRPVVPALMAAIAALSIAGCADSAAEAEPEGPLVVEEFPVTTGSDAAREHFLAGREAMDTGNETEARKQFAMATEEDPGFVLAHLRAASVAGSFPAFRRHLDAAAEAADGVSEAEQLLVSLEGLDEVDRKVDGPPAGRLAGVIALLDQKEPA